MADYKEQQKEKWLYLECYSGISGDMTVGALLDLGASEERLKQALASLGVDGYHLHFGRTKKCGIDAFDFDVHLEEEGHSHGHEHSHEYEHNHEHEYSHEHEHDHEHEHSHEHSHEHEHEHSHEHEHEHSHEHEHGHDHAHVHRNITDIFTIIDRLQEEESVKALAKQMFTIVAEAESKAHGIPLQEVHFHEVGAIDSIVDIIGASVCFADLGVTQVVVSPLAEGTGYVRCQHGVMPVPVPATANIAAACGLKLKLTDNDGEMVTPTGAAIAAALRTEEKLPEHYYIEKIGLGAGKKEFKNANILRAMLICPEERGHLPEHNSLWVLESNLDDCTGEALGYALECLMEEGAKDAWYTPAYMKKNRPAYVLHVLCEEPQVEEMESLIFAHTTTIGIRRYPVERTSLRRDVRTVHTRYGAAKVKCCTRGEKTYVYPEYESVKEICREQGLEFKEVYHGVKADGMEEIL